MFSNHKELDRAGRGTASRIEIGTSMTGPNIDHAEIRFLIEKNADGIIVVDEMGVVLFANPAAEQIFGRSSASLTGSPIGIPFVAGDMTEIAIHRPGGDQIDAEIRVVETIWDHRPARLATIRDISARRAIEERLRHTAKMEAVGRLTAGIAHDFNNHLTVVLGNLESARRRFANVDPALTRALENATRGAQQAAVLTERLLAFARRKPLEPRLLNPDEVILRVSDLLQRTLGEKINIQAKISQDVWGIEADPTELEAAILNLAVNARDAMPSGGNLILETANVERAGPDDGEFGNRPHVLISVTDSGMGMTPDVLDHAFEPFFTTKNDGRGTGLGLSQVYGFVKQSDGHVRLFSQPNVGTTVKIFFPAIAKPNLASPGIGLAVTQQQTLAENQLQIRVARSGETILVVEDEEDVRNYTVSSLLELGYLVYEAADAETALNILQTKPEIALLFTDLGLPGEIDGKTLADRAQSSRPSLKVLITTAYAGQSLIHEGRLDPGIELIKKPFSFGALAARIRELLDGDVGQKETGSRILVVEDEFLLSAFVADVLAEWGLTAEVAGSFKEGLTKVQNSGDSLAGAIVDLGLPDRSGGELVTEIRSLYPDIPIVLATGYANDDVREQFAALERLQILTKPFNPHELATALNRIGVDVTGH
ncbi:response regulator [Bradyrhizobium sp. 139]|uniref:response regulator n=1 Tax=Bradyrhizobium sp. 139 TaxID=2782616 RepID=UPI001FF9A976|nr:response regulator [Bradyrhizobium sp. 139]MCK1745824.1 response regulator [Bradyrhizobium sp. 139]